MYIGDIGDGRDLGYRCDAEHCKRRAKYESRSKLQIVTGFWSILHYCERHKHHADCGTYCVQPREALKRLPEAVRAGVGCIPPNTVAMPAGRGTDSKYPNPCGPARETGAER